MPHNFDDEELRLLLEAKEMFQKAWKIIDQALLAKYTALAKKEEEEKEKSNNG